MVASQKSDVPEKPGPVEEKVRSDVAALVTTHPMGEALAAMAFALARTLDNGAGLAVAAVNRELRANLLELAGMVDDDDEDLDALLSSPVRDSPDAGEGDVGPGDSGGGPPAR